MSEVKLDATQKAVASWDFKKQGNLRVVGGAGSGKTGTLAYTVAKALLVDGVPPERICVMAFNRDAAREIRRRLEGLVGTANLEAMSVGTFHAIGRRWLAASDPAAWDMTKCIDLPASSRTRGVPSLKMLWRRAVVFGQMPGTGEPSLVVAGEPDYHLREVQLLRAGGHTPETASPSRDCACLLEAWHMVRSAKKALGLWDFDDVLEHWLEALQSRPMGWFDLVIVDEAQDNTRIRLDIAVALAGTEGNIALIGDLRQTVNVWAGAYPELFHQADIRLKAETLTLGYNYRSVPSIVALANAFAKGKPWNLGDMQRPSREGEHPVLPPKAYETADDMFKGWAREIKTDQEEAGNKSRAVLLRTRGLITHCSVVLMAAGIPVQVQGAPPPLETDEGKVMVNYIKAVYENDFRAFCEIVNRPNRYFSMKLQAGLKARRPKEGEFVEDVLVDYIYRTRTSPRVRKGLEKFARTMASWRRKPWEEGVGAILASLLGNWKDVGEAHESDSTNVLRAAFGMATLFPSAEAFLNFADPLTRPAGIIMPPVILSTIHRAKGREWDQVYMDATQGYLPLYRVQDKEQREEEERLFYVAMTRARQDLLIGFFFVDRNPDVPCGLSTFGESLWAEEDIRPPDPDVDPNNGAEIDEMGGVDPADP
jgi:DNA helicase-2/ATP-dependent DNA helicase PcrA